MIKFEEEIEKRMEILGEDFDENDELTQLSLFPNPSTGLVNLEYIAANQENVTINVVNMIGATVFTTNASVAGTLNKSLDLSNLTKGVYMVNVSSENGTVTKKLVIQ